MSELTSLLSRPAAQLFTTKTIVKEYPHKFRIYKYNKPEPKTITEEQRKFCLAKQPASNPEESKIASIRRTKTVISDLIQCNDFEWFGTLTFSPDKVDRHNPKAVKAKLDNWLSNVQRRYKFKYILIPEHHKDGAIHFHTLLSGLPDDALVDSTKVDKKGRKIYNLKHYKLGFSNISRIGNKTATANYCRKYITKSMITEENQKRYWASRDLVRPVYHYNLEPSDLARSEGAHATLEYHTDLYDIFEVLKPASTPFLDSGTAKPDLNMSRWRPSYGTT